MGGHVAAGISGFGEFAAQIKSGKLRALAISSDKRVPGIDIPTLKEQGIDVELVNWRGVFGAPGISEAQKKELIDVIGKAVKSASWQDTLKRNDWSDAYVAGDAFKTFLDADTKRILGAAILGTGGDEAIHGLLDMMNADQPLSTLQWAVPIHPTVSELIPTLVGDLRPA